MKPTVIWTGSTRLDLADPDPASIRIEDIARNLSRIPRFLGATRHPHSVAEHSLSCAYVAWMGRRDRRRATEPERRLELCCLMHDAAEAFVGDVTRPVRALCPGFEAVEARVWRAVCARFGLPEELPDEVRRIDDVVLATERFQLIEDPDPWPGLPDMQPGALQPFERHPWTVAQAFLVRARGLGLVS